MLARVTTRARPLGHVPLLCPVLPIASTSQLPPPAIRHTSKVHLSYLHTRRVLSHVPQSPSKSSEAAQQVLGHRRLHTSVNCKAPSVTSATKAKSEGGQVGGDLVDEAIPHETVRLVDPSTSGLLAPAKLQDLLIALDRTRFRIVLVDERPEVPICRIVDVKAKYEKERAKSKAKKEKKVAAAAGGGVGASVGTKELLVTWAVGENDLKHKMTKGKELISKGYRVTVVVTNNSKGAKSSEADKSRVESTITSALLEVGKLVRKRTVGERFEIEVKP